MVHICGAKAQRERYVQLRVDNPGLRLRSDSMLGPSKQVTVTTSKKTSLEKPKECFVELDVYKRDFPDQAANLKESDLIWEYIDDQWKQGASWLYVDVVFLFICKKYVMYTYIHKHINTYIC